MQFCDPMDLRGDYLTDRIIKPAIHSIKILHLNLICWPVRLARISEIGSNLFDLQTTVLECITDASLTDKQKNALRCLYNQHPKNAELEAQKINWERDEASQSKIEEHPAKDREQKATGMTLTTHVLTHLNIPNTLQRQYKLQGQPLTVERPSQA